MCLHRDVTWASYQIRKIAGCACAGNAEKVFPRLRIQREPLVSDHGTCVTHVPWCMSESLTRGGGENVPAYPAHAHPQFYVYDKRPITSHKVWEWVTCYILQTFFLVFKCLFCYFIIIEWHCHEKTNPPITSKQVTDLQTLLAPDLFNNCNMICMLCYMVSLTCSSLSNRDGGSCWPGTVK